MTTKPWRAKPGLWLAGGMAALAVAAGLAWALWRPVSVEAFQVQAAPLVRTLQFSARVASDARVDIGSTLTARVVDTLVDEGATVRKGQVLVRLESDELRAALAQAEAAEQQAAARLSGLRSTGRRSSVAGVAQAESVLRAAEAERRRVRDLVTQGFVSGSRLDEAERAVAVAEAQLAAAQAQRSANADAGTDVAQANAALALARAATQAARARLAQADLRAPADGRVLVRSVEPGQIVQPGRALLQLALAGPTLLEAQVDERYLEQLRPGQSATVVADAYPQQRFAAQVQSIAALVDAQRGAIEVKLAPQPPLPGFLREDMTLSVEVETARVERTLAVPLTALREGATVPGDLRVFVVEDGRVAERAVRLGLRTLDAAQVSAGLNEGDWVLLGSAPAAGRRVQPRPVANALTAAGTRRAEDAGAVINNAWSR